MRLTAAVVAATVALLAACTGEETPRWSRLEVALPGEVLTLTGAGRSVLVGSYAPDEPRARLTLVDGTGEGRVVPATPAPGYGSVARWLGVAVDGGSVIAVGGARGGAHANVRWTEWRGGLTGIRDVPQEFWTFGGWEMGDLVGVASADGRPLVVGSWASARTGLDVAVWETEGDRWVRRSSAGTPLESSPAELLSPSAVAARHGGFVITGSTTRLSSGLPITAVIWAGRRSAEGVIWERHDLAGPAPAEAKSITCSGAECLVVGRVRGHLATWLLRDGSPRLVEVEEVPVADTDVVLAPARSARHWYVVVRSGKSAHGLVGDADGTGWQERALPSGAPVALASTPDGIWLATSAEGHSSLWKAAEDDP